jgi:hypothetical protein
MQPSGDAHYRDVLRALDSAFKFGQDVWVSPPDCPKCGKPLKKAGDVFESRGDWICDGDHDGKRIWFNVELTTILRNRAAQAK